MISRAHRCCNCTAETAVFNTIAIFSLDQETGACTRIENVDCAYPCLCLCLMPLPLPRAGDKLILPFCSVTSSTCWSNTRCACVVDAGGGNMPWSHTFAGANDGLLLVQNQHTKVKEVIDPKEDAGKVHLCPCPPPSPLQRNSIAAQSVRAALHAAKQLHAVAAVG
jgi:hypothetical protein